jgi:hypothetical protein
MGFLVGLSLDDFKSGFPQFHDLWPILLHASVELASLFLIFCEFVPTLALTMLLTIPKPEDYDAILLSVATTCSTALLLLYTQWRLQWMSHIELGGGALAVVAFFVYIADYQSSLEGRKVSLALFDHIV